MKAMRYIVLAIVLIGAISIRSVQSFSLLGYKWPNRVFRYYVNPENQDIDPEMAISSIRSASKSWKPWCKAVYGGTTTARRAKNDGTNNVFFRKSPYIVLASTYIFSKDDQILDVDIVFCDNPWKFFAGNKGCENGYYITDVATHEFGHAIGLGHSRNKEATMYKRCSVCGSTERSLEIDDRNAADRLYGSPQVTALVVQQ